jgi:hypothetical protein
MANIAVTKGYEWTSGETVTPTKLNSAATPVVAISGIVNADVDSNAAIALSKLATGALPSGITVASANLVDGTIVNADISAGADISMSKLATGALPSAITVSSANLVNGTIVNDDISSVANIDMSKLATGALPTAITVASANLVNGTIVNDDINSAAAIVHSKLANITSGHVLLGNASNVPTATALSGDVTVSNTGVTAIGAGKVVTAMIGDDQVTDDKLSLAANDGEIKKALNADNSPPIYACRAWVNFNGTRNATDTGASTNGANVLIRASGNVSSVLKNGTGDYTITFTTAMPDANYAVSGSTQIDQSGNGQCGEFGIFRGSGYSPATSSVRVRTNNGAQSAADVLVASFAIFR